MTGKRRRYKAEFTFKVALEAAKEIKTISQLVSEYELHSNQISIQKKLVTLLQFRYCCRIH